MAATRCPRCGKPAVLVESRGIGAVETEAGCREVTERRISCPPPAGCGADASEVIVVWRVDIVHGVSHKRFVARH